MSKYLFFFVFFVFNFFYLNAQVDLCEPDTTYAGSGSYINPEPYHPRLNPDAGILDSACVNHDYSFVFTAVVPDSLLGFTLDSIVIEENGILNIPTGIGYKCNPPNCNFSSGTIGCFELNGKPEPGNALTYYDLKMKVKIVVGGGLLTISDTLPDILSDSAHYFLPLFGEDCTTGIYDNAVQKFDVRIKTNPIYNLLEFNVISDSNDKIDYSIYSINGKKVINNNESYFTNEIRENISGLSPGIYFLKVKQGNNLITKKFTIFN